MPEDISNKQVLDTLMQALNNVKKEVNDSIEEAKQEIKIENQKLIQAIADHSVKINKLFEICERVEQRCVKIERDIRKNNVLIFGMEIPENQSLLQFTLGKLTELTGVILQETDVNNIYQFKTQNNAPVKVEFARYLTKELLLKNCFKLKGSKITVVNDLCPEDRSDQKILKKHLNEARSKHYLAKIKKNTLIVNNEVYTVQDLRRIDSEEDTDKIDTNKRPNSEPTTPRHTFANEAQGQMKTTGKRLNSSPADQKKEDNIKITRTNSTSSTRSEKNERPKRTQKSNVN